jgi:hypothetical protein
VGDFRAPHRKTAADVVEHGPAIMMERYAGDASKVEFFSIHLENSVELVIPPISVLQSDHEHQTPRRQHH